MSGNGGLVGAEPFKCKFQFFPGIHPHGTSASMAGALVEMSWNEALVCESKGWGKLIRGWRPHDTRPGLKDQRSFRDARKADRENAVCQQERQAADEARREKHMLESCPSGPLYSSRETVQVPEKVIVDKAVTETVVVTAFQTPEKVQDTVIRPQLARQPDNLLAAEASDATTEVTRASSSNDAVADSNPFAAGAQLNETLGGLIHARNLFKRTVARHLDATTCSSKKVMSIGEVNLYIGDTKNGRPHGGGIMLLYKAVADPSSNTDPQTNIDALNKEPRWSVTQHIGPFVDGRAHGAGIVISSTGSVAQGEFDCNRRIGEFVILEPSGNRFQETYDGFGTGKRIRRKKITGNYRETDSKATTAEIQPAIVCSHCNSKFHSDYNHNFACRKHAANFVSGEGDAGIWACCGNREKNNPGCQFVPHLELSS